MSHRLTQTPSQPPTNGILEKITAISVFWKVLKKMQLQSVILKKMQTHANTQLHFYLVKCKHHKCSRDLHSLKHASISNKKAVPCESGAAISIERASRAEQARGRDFKHTGDTKHGWSGVFESRRHQVSYIAVIFDARKHHVS